MNTNHLLALKAAGVAGLLAMAGLAASTTAASAHYTTTRCDGDGDRCAVVRCDDDGDDCYRVRSYYRGYGYERPYRRWVCDWDGDDCHWTYGGYHRSHIGVHFGWHD